MTTSPVIKVMVCVDLVAAGGAAPGLAAIAGGWIAAIPPATSPAAVAAAINRRRARPGAEGCKGNDMQHVLSPPLQPGE
ncbi:hypothetical protein ONA70_02630 [Micromonospora yasonensis]|uniref:hypothetical protein n=1 Tax=Micromonospora yasonensis TaxID=1128667 RepID=UPI00222FA773|nr:hypothetical protein [Micromonospora yasonensis]MCW3838992.1 hypothetical protein [Micromonospora yasonensis]